MRIVKLKSTLKKIIQVEVYDRVAVGAKVSVLDGSVILLLVHWPADGSVKDYLANFKYAIGKRLLVEDMYLIFDRYYGYSTKSVTRGSRAIGVSRVHHMQVNSKLPAQKILLASSQNKKQLMQLIVDDLVQDKKFHEDNTQHHKLVRTCSCKYANMKCTIQCNFSFVLHSYHWFCSIFPLYCPTRYRAGYYNDFSTIIPEIYLILWSYENCSTGLY